MPAADFGFDRGLIWRVELEIGVPGRGPRGQQQDAAAVALHQHALQGRAAGPAVVHIGNPIVPFVPKPFEPLVAVVGEVCTTSFRASSFSPRQAATIGSQAQHVLP